MPEAARFMAYKWGLGLLAAVAQSAVYFAIGHLHWARSTDLLATQFDRAIPFLPWTVWFYLPFYAGIFLMGIIGFSSRAVFHRALGGVAAIMTVGALGHIFVQAEFPRPVLPAGTLDPSMAFLAAIQTIDPPGNVFPSLHVAHTSALALLLRHDRPRLGLVAMVMAVMLACSTLTTKQHFLADVVAGFIMAVVVRALVLRGLPVRARAVA